MTATDKISQAEALGRAAFASGKRCVPVHDRELMPLLAGDRIGDCIPVLDAWLKGWTVANLSSLRDHPGFAASW